MRKRPVKVFELSLDPLVRPQLRKELGFVAEGPNVDAQRDHAKAHLVARGLSVRSMSVATSNEILAYVRPGNGTGARARRTVQESVWKPQARQGGRK